jgi:hypothetical protein
MASFMDTSSITIEFNEPSRRKPGASGLPLRLADGSLWLLAVPRYRSNGATLTVPDVDREIAQLFDSSILHGEVSLRDVWSAARTLLLANYNLTDLEFCELFNFDREEERRAVAIVVEAIFGPEDSPRTYTDWVRASLLANGIVPATVQPADLANVLSILVATKRTIPASQFIDASRSVEEQSALEGLV